MKTIELKKEVWVSQLGRFATPVSKKDDTVSVRFETTDSKGNTKRFISKFKESQFLNLL